MIDTSIRELNCIIINTVGHDSVDFPIPKTTGCDVRTVDLFSPSVIDFNVTKRGAVFTKRHKIIINAILNGWSDDIRMVAFGTQDHEVK